MNGAEIASRAEFFCCDEDSSSIFNLSIVDNKRNNIQTENYYYDVVECGGEQGRHRWNIIEIIIVGGGWGPFNTRAYQWSAHYYCLLSLDIWS